MYLNTDICEWNGMHCSGRITQLTTLVVWTELVRLFFPITFLSHFDSALFFKGRLGRREKTTKYLPYNQVSLQLRYKVRQLAVNTMNSCLYLTLWMMKDCGISNLGYYLSQKEKDSSSLKCLSSYFWKLALISSSTKPFLLTHCFNTYCWGRLENHRYFNFQPVHLVMVSTDVSDHFISWDLCSTFIWFKCSFYLRCEGPWSQAYDTHMTPTPVTKSIK